MTTMTLENDRCQCAACGEYFLTVEAFDKHRTGRFGRPGTRRCVDRDGMHRRKLVREEGWWRVWNPPENTPTI